MRFEVFGSFWGMFDAGESVCVRNLTRQGALIEAHQPLAIESIQSVSLMLDGQPATADARVRHLEPLHHPDRYLVGVEFLSTSSAFCDAIDRVLAQRSSPTELR